MGTTTASLHLIAIATPPNEVRVRIGRAYRQLGYIEAERGAVADKTVLVMPGPCGRAFSLYDSDNALVDNGELKDLGVLLSKAAKATAVFTSVYDGDRFEMLLYSKGKPVDAVAGSDDELPDGLPRMTSSKRPGKWSALCGLRIDANAMADILDAHAAQAEDSLSRLTGLLGLDPAAALTTFSDLERAAIGSKFPDLDQDGEGVMRLYFRHDPGAPRVAAGVPALRYHHADEDFPYHQVAPAAWPVLPGPLRCQWSLLSLSAGFDRATIRVAVDGNPSFRVESASVAAFKFYNGQIVGAAGPRGPEDGPATAQAALDGDGRFRISLEGLGVPARERSSTTDILVLVAVSLSAGRGTAALSGTFEANGAEPLELPAVSFAAVEPCWIPIVSGAHARFEEDGSGRGATHRAEAERITASARGSSLALNQPSVRSSVAVYVDDAGLHPLQGLIERWLEPLADVDGTFTLRTEKRMTASGHVGKTRIEASAKELPASKAWPKMFAEGSDLQTIRAGFTPRGGTHPVLGFGVQTSLGVEWSSRDLLAGTLEAMRGRAITGLREGGTVHVFRWCLNHPRCTGLVGDHDAAGPDWNDALDARVDLLQAWTANWCWIPLFDRADGYATTPYEDVSTLNWFRGIVAGDNGLHHLKMEAGWCARVLRAVTPDLWLGPDLMRDVEIDALRAVADLEPGAHATRVRLRNGAKLEELEAALLQVLPVESVRLAARARRD